MKRLMATNHRLPTLSALALLILVAISTGAQQDSDATRIEAVPVADGIFMLTGAGGNIGLSVGDDAAFVIDDQFAPLTKKILAAIAEKTDRQVRFVINTHWHGDHTGGNENMGQAGAIIVAHENVRKRMSTEQFIEAFDTRVPPSPAAALPVVTFADSITFHWNGDDIRVFHVGPAHTDGDSVIHFQKANVIHAGDTFFNGLYPFIDSSSGGSIDGMIAAAELVLAIADERTKIIPGHGPLCQKAQLQASYDMLVVARDRIRKLMDEGNTRDEVIAAKPTADLDEEWGGGFLQADVWVGIVFDGLATK
ncbi:MAG: MBL fold metallo-hydrolase [bacterium]|nr:MBL fold metallo-hydrolase [bacterium]